MDTLEAIFTRRSIRKYRADAVSEDQIETLLKAAMFAPSAANRQPWHFIVISDRSLLDAVPQFHEYAAFLRGAPLAILVCADENLQKVGCWEQDCAAATQNILLAAHALGLGTCWIGIQPVAERIAGVRLLFNLPEHVQPFSLIAVGHPADQPTQPDRYKPERVHTNSW